MIRKLFHRIAQGLIVMVVLFTITFFLCRALPGGPYVSEKALPAHVKELMMERDGYNKPIHVQYAKRLSNLLRGDPGLSSRLSGRPVRDVIVQAFPVSFHLGVVSMALALVIGVPAGVISAWKKNTRVDYLVMASAMVGLCLPSFVIGPIMAETMGREWRWFPAMGWNTTEPLSWVLPMTTLGMVYAAYLARLTRTGMLEVLSQDFVRTAQAKGVPTHLILIKHCLRGGLIPSAAYIGPAFAGIISGSLVIESVFQVPGLGRHFVKAIETNDVNVIMGIVLLYGGLVVLGNIASDFLILWLNPRARAQS
ncbi:MAG: ABC transporter permease [Akkermansiaceae bacterium]